AHPKLTAAGGAGSAEPGDGVPRQALEEPRFSSCNLPPGINKQSATSSLPPALDGIGTGCCGALRFADAQLENNFLGRKNSREEPLKDHRFDVNPPIHPLQNRKVTIVEALFEHRESGRTPVVGPVLQLPLFVKPQAPPPQLLIIIKG